MITLGCTPETPTQPLTATTSQNEIAAILAGQIVFFDITTSYGIYIANPDGSRLGRISPQGALDIDPAVSHDGDALPESRDAFFALTREERVIGAYSVLGDADAAIPAIQRLLSRDGNLAANALRLDPMYAPIRNDPRFNQVISVSTH